MALNERHQSGQGQVIDASMVEGAAYLSSFLWTSRDVPFLWPESGNRGEGLLDGGASMYDTYETKDGKFLAVGALEPQFFAAFLRGLGVEDADKLPDDPLGEDMKRVFAEKFKERTRDEWCRVFDDVDACVTPVLEWNEAPMHRHNRERHSFHQSGVPLPAPKLDRTPAKPTDFSQVSLGMHTESVLSELGYGTEELERFVTEKVVFQKRKSGL